MYGPIELVLLGCLFNLLISVLHSAGAFDLTAGGSCGVGSDRKCFLWGMLRYYARCKVRIRHRFRIQIGCLWGQQLLELGETRMLCFVLSFSAVVGRGWWMDGCGSCIHWRVTDGSRASRPRRTAQDQYTTAVRDWYSRCVSAAESAYTSALMILGSAAFPVRASLSGPDQSLLTSSVSCGSGVMDVLDKSTYEHASRVLQPDT